MKAPDKIYLQACGDCPGFDSCQSCKFDDLEEVTWAEEKVWEKDIPYIRKDALLEWARKHQCEQGFEDGEAEHGYQAAIRDLIKHIESL